MKNWKTFCVAMLITSILNDPTIWGPKKKNTLLSRNTGDQKNFHPGGRKFVLKWFSGDLLFPSLVSFAFFDSCFSCLFVGFWNQKCIFWYTFNYAGRWLIKNFSPNRFQETRLLVFLAWPAHSNMKTVTSSPFHFFHFTKYLIPQ